MKSSNHKLWSAFSIVMLGLFALVQLSCENSVSSQIDTSGTPEISGVRYVNPDSSRDINKIGPGDVVALEGNNMDATTHVYFNGYEASFNPTLATDTTLIVTVPSDMPFGSMDPDSEVMNTIKVSNSNGESSIDFNVLPPPPLINRISDEFAEAGKEITVEGQYLYLVNKVVFPGGVEANDYQSSADGTSLKVTVPSGAASGDIKVSTSSGISTTTPGVGFRDTTGMICDFDGVFSYQYWSASLSSDASLYPGNEGQYAILSVSNVPSGNSAWWNGGRSINLNPMQWVKTSDMGEAPAKFAIKFEIYVKDSWKNGTLLIRAANPWEYTARLEPWRDASHSTFTTHGWQTVQIPLNQFKTADGDGVNGAGTALKSLSSLLSSDGTAPTTGIMLVNDTEGTIDQLDMAIDNIRVVRIAN